MPRNNVFRSTSLRACLLAGSVSVAGLVAGCRSSCPNPAKVYCPDDFTAAARASLNDGLERQAANGALLDQTLWNSHFYEDSEELRPSGRAFLDRVARNYPYSCAGYYLQSAHDLEVDPVEMDAWFQRRDELNALRLKSAAAYLERVAPGNQLVAQVHDRPQPWMPSDESGRAFILMSRKAPQGLLPPEITASNFSFGGGSGDFGSSVGGGFGGFTESLPPALGGAFPGDASLPEFGSEVPTGPSEYSGPPEYSSPSDSGSTAPIP